MMRFGKALVLVPTLATALMLTGCGDGNSAATGADASGGGAATLTHAADSGSVPAAMTAFTDDGDVAEIAIEGTDRMQFDIDSFTVRPGQMVRLTLEHVGQLPAQSMGHNVVILQQSDDPFEFGADVSEQGGALDNHYVPDVLRDRVIAFTEIIGGGETTVVEFQAPAEAGDYPFLCSFPGHAGMMNGVMEVQE